jgi:hypothetical protein
MKQRRFKCKGCKFAYNNCKAESRFKEKYVCFVYQEFEPVSLEAFLKNRMNETYETIIIDGKLDAHNYFKFRRYENLYKALSEASCGEDIRSSNEIHKEILEFFKRKFGIDQRED